MLRALLMTIVAVAMAAGALAHNDPGKMHGQPLMEALQKGGYTILVRHARTDRSVPVRETPGTIPALRSDQRNLTAAGEEDVRLMQAVVEKYALPIGEVITSPLYRCRETADAFGAATVSMTLRTFPTTDATAALVAATPAPGTNRVLVTHHFVIENHVPGIAVGDIAESEAAVVRPVGGGKVELVGKIKLADWQALAGGAAVAQEPARPASSYTTHGAEAAGSGPVAIPATPAGRLASGYLEAFNSGDAGRMRAFIESSLVPVADRPTEARVESYLRLFADHGAITPVAVQSSDDGKVALRGHSKRGNLIVTVIASTEQKDRAQSVIFAIEGGGGH